MLTLLIIAAVAIGYCESIPLHSSSVAYIKTGECEADEVCLYNYAVDQQFGNHGSEQNLSFSATVEIGCHSVGEFNETSATQFCMSVSDVNVEGFAFNTTTNKDKEQQNEMVDQLLSQWFCFIQTDDGKVVAVQHGSDEKQSAIDLKKSIAAAFQANFKGTDEEKESDPQSEHIAHYKHEQGPSNVKKMHRHIDGDDVIDYSTGAKKKNIKLLKDEDIEYRDGFLYHSAGSIVLRIKEGQDPKAVEKSVSEAFVAEGSFTLDLEHCYVPAKHVQSRRRRSVSEEMQKDSKEEDIQTHYDKLQHARERMSLLRKNIPSVSDALQELHTNPENLRLFDMLEHLLELEYQFGNLPEYLPAVEDVLAYYQMIGSSEIDQDAKMREVLYSLFSAEGSLASQMILLEALQSSFTDEEKATVTIVISTVQNAHMEFVAGLQQLLLTMEDSVEKDSLLLSFGALASNAQPDVEFAIATFLVQQISSVNDNDISVHLLLAMGNTGSNHVVSTIIDYVNHPSKEIQKAALQALVKFTYLEQVQSSLGELVASGPDEEILNIVTKILIEGQLYAEEMDIEISMESSYPMLSSLVTAVLSTNDTELIGRVALYARKVGGERALSLLHQLHTRLRRGSDWDASNSNYNCVASQSSRASDVSTYPKHKAYIYGKRLGTSDVNMKVAGGVFLGTSNDCNNMKAFARACAQANVFSESRNLAEIELSAQKSGSTISGRGYAQVGGTTLLNYARSVDATYCLSYDRSLYESRRRLFRFSYSIWIYVGYVEASISLYLSLTADFDAEMCGSLNVNELLSATTGIVPRVTLTLEGSASYTFIEVARVGFSAEADIAYQIEPRATGKVCASACSSLDYQTCAGLYQSWPGNTISLYAWYQTREVEWCEGWWGISYPCGYDWGSRTRWDALSWSWSLGSSSRRALTESCYPRSSSCSASPL